MDLEHERRLTEAEARGKSNTKRIDDVEKRQDDLEVLVSSVAKMATQMEYMEKNLKSIGEKVDNIAAKPGKRFDDIVDKLIWLFVGGAGAFLLTQLGL